jgi:cell division protein FtsB
MKDFQHKKDFRNILYSRPVLVFLGLLVLFFAWGVFGFMGKMQTTKENKQMVENKVTELQNQKEKLSMDIEKLKTDEGIEESIRTKFGLAKEGEGEIVIVEEKTPSPPIEKSNGGFFSFFKNLFK